MTTERNRADVASGAASALSNPLLQYAVAGVLVYFLLRWAVPDLGKRFKQAFGDGVDTFLGALSSIVGAPESQTLADRDRGDELKGLLAAPQGDRSLSDLVDEPGTFLKKLILG